MRRVLRSPITYALLIVIVVLVVIGVLRQGPAPTTLGTGQFQADLASGKVVSATIHDGQEKVTGKLVGGTSYQVTYPDRYTPQITADIAKAVPDFKTDHPHANPLVAALLNYLPLLILLGFFGYLLYSTQGGGRLTQFGRIKAKTASKDQPKVTFADVAGADEAVAELTEIKDFLESPSRFEALGARIPKGVLLVGPPGTGKTLLARAVAGEAGVPFFSISGSDFVEMFVGVGASRVRSLFEQAKSSAPAIVFMDEIDAVGRHRGAGMGGGHDEREQTLNQLLVEMDGFDVRQGVILIAATNRPDILDPALLRPGRFDRQITVDRPDKLGRRKILDVHAHGKPLGPSISLDVLAKRTPGFTGADLSNLLNEAALLTARRNLKQIGMRECEEAIDRVLAGPERKTLVLSDHDKAITAYHEAGHVIVGHVLPHADPIHKVSIVARSRSLGLTFTLPADDKFNHSRSELRDAMAMCMGGRSAEELVFDEPTTGAENDIEKATRLARAMVTEYGMSDTLGPQQLSEPGGEVFLGREMGSKTHYSDQIAAAIDAEVRHLIDEAHDRARTILAAHATTLETLARALIDQETLDTPELMAIIGGLEPWQVPAGDIPAPGQDVATTRSGRAPRRARSESAPGGSSDGSGGPGTRPVGAGMLARQTRGEGVSSPVRGEGQGSPAPRRRAP
ncbi:MAG: ATP-dependent zinc metalloprotease FtsH, partial [Actinomycetota bacterium]|nr:ATP-dependent zinc metalloprotease FtsH [Actinomycetota bacterium]